MDIATPPTGSRIQDLGDRLVVRFRPKRSWGELVFLAAWLTVWTVGGIAAIGELLTGDWSGRPFVLLWLCAWAYGEWMVTGIIAWQLFGRELLIVTPEQIEVRKEVGRCARTKLYEVALVRDFGAARVPSPEDERPRKDFCLEFAYDDEIVRVGDGMGEREAEHIAASVSARIHPRRTWWGEEVPAEPDESPPEAAAPAAPRQRRRLRTLTQIVFPLLVLAAIASLVVAGRRDSDQGSAPQPPPGDASTRGPVGPQDPFATRRVLASAKTFYALTSAKTTVLSQPVCTPHPTWSQWTCTVTARTTLAPFAGRALRYRCSAVSTPQPGGSSAGRGVLCGPDPPPPLEG
ncbi:MAG TPA: hypothetical protein VF963_05845 [Gaiellaceae bacterium]